MSDIETSENESDQGDTNGSRRMRRASRYQRAKERQTAQKASDQRFYNAMFGLMGILALFAILLGAIMLNGLPTGVPGMQGWTSPWLFGFTKMEVAGFAFVGLVSLSVWLRMRGKR